MPAVGRANPRAPLKGNTHPQKHSIPKSKPRQQIQKLVQKTPKDPSPVESEDEAYGGSHDTDEETEITAVISQSNDLERSQMNSVASKPRRAPASSVTGRQNGKAVTNKNGMSQRTVKGGGGGEQSRANKVAKADTITDLDHVDPTFGDEQRKIIQDFQKAYTQCDGALPLAEEVNHLCAIAGVYKKSAVGTLNMYNLLRASGLYNICLTKLDSEPQLYAEIKDLLISLEETAMRRILKIKTTLCPLFAHDKKMAEHIKELQEIRDLCQADFDNVLLCLRNLPSMSAVLKGKLQTQRQVKAEDNIIATSAMMYAEVSARMRALLARILAECMELQGKPPCKYAMIAHKRLGSKDITPFEPIAIYLVIEKDSAATKTYFRNTLTLLGMKMINLGETGLSSLRIRSLSWFINQSTKHSGLALENFIDDNEKKDFSVIPLDCIRTPKDLADLAKSDKQADRDAIMHLVNCATFITGEVKIFKELSAVRQAVLQRDQTEQDHKTKLYARLRQSVAASDPFTSIGMKDRYEERMRDDILAFPKVLLEEIFDLEKSLQSESTINKIEEIMPLGSEIPYARISILSEVQNGIKSTLSTRLEFPPEAPTPSPEPIKLPIIQPYVPQPKRISGTWTIEEVEENAKVKSPPIGNSEALKKLKEKKHQRRATYGKYYQLVQRQNAQVANKPPIKRESGSTRTVSTNSKSSHLSSSSDGSLSKTTEDSNSKVGVSKRNVKAALIKKVPTPEPIERFINEVPVFEGKQKSLLSEASARYLVLLHCLTASIKLSFNSDNQIATQHAKHFSMDKIAFEATYVKILQIMVPLIEQLRSMLSSGGTAASFKKGLSKLDLTPDDDEFIVALAYFHNKQYKESCQAVYQYLESRSDITFIGEPFPNDLTEVCQELMEDGLIGQDRYESIHVLMGHCQMRRQDYSEALAYWSELLPKGNTPEKKAALYDNIHQCCLKLKRNDDAYKAVHRALTIYRELKQRGATTLDDEIERLKQVKAELAAKGATL